MPSTASSLPADLAQLVSELTAVECDAEAVVAGIDDEQFNWSPGSDAWSIAQCLDHLNNANTVYMAGVTAAIEEARRRGNRRVRPIASSWFGRRFVQAMEPPVTIKMRAPRAIRPAPRKYKAEVWPAFVRIHGQIRACIEQSADVDLNCPYMKNPFFRMVRMRPGTALRIIAAHDRRHVWQARCVREDERFPRS